MKSGAADCGRSRKWIFLGLALAVAGVAIALFLTRTRPPRKEIPGPPERPRNELVLRDGRLFDSDLPFTGIVVEHFGDGGMKSRSAVSNGLLEGLSEGWHTNGVLQVKEHFVRGVSHGIRTKYHPNGRKLSVVNVVEGKLEGLYERWHENGALAEQIHLTNGVAHGESLAFHPDGSLKARVRLDHGAVIEQSFWEPGQVR